MDRLVGKVSLRIQQLDVKLETKLKGRREPFVTIAVSVQYQIQPEDSPLAFYSLENPSQQITAFVHDIVRSHVQNRIFSSTDALGEAVKAKLSEMVEEFGYR
jgi:regulator of protease activity HflC (stomatin/prohibitin superfamily)